MARQEENSSRGREQTIEGRGLKQAIEGRGLKDMGMLLIENKSVAQPLSEIYL